MSDEDKVLAVIKDMCNKDHTVGMKHMHDNCDFVRPTGNPLNKKEWDNMMTVSYTHLTLPTKRIV